MKAELKNISAGIVGSAGYTGGELIRLLLHHPQVSLQCLVSESHAGKRVSEKHIDLFGETDLCFADRLPPDVPEVIFLAAGHGKSSAYLHGNQFSPDIKVIDLSGDFRSRDNDREFVYGLPELNKEKIKSANRIANCGCFATAIQLALLPLVSKDLIENDVHIHAITGSTGAGSELKETSHFSYRDNNVSVYRPFEHQHLLEISESFRQLNPSFDQEINFIPVRGNFTRGIFCTAYTHYNGTHEEAYRLYTDFYHDDPFTIVTDQPVCLKQVINTNKCLLFVEVIKGKILVHSVLDNLLKGASGQAVQNMNIMFGIEESSGLNLKPIAF